MLPTVVDCHEIPFNGEHESHTRTRAVEDALQSEAEFMNHFPGFYSNLREAVKKIEMTQFEAIPHEVFMRAFLCKAVDVTEL